MTDAIDGYGGDHAALMEAAELALDQAKIARDISTQIACIDLIDYLEGRALASRRAVALIKHIAGHQGAGARPAAPVGAP